MMDPNAPQFAPRNNAEFQAFWHQRRHQIRRANPGPNAFNTALLLWNIAHEQGIPTGQIVGALVTSGYSAWSAARYLGSGLYSRLNYAWNNRQDDDSGYSENEEGEPSVPNLPASAPIEEMSMSMRGPTGEAHAQKRKHTEEHGMESVTHGNTPATGTGQANYIEKYVPVNFPDKFTVKEKWCDSYVLRTTGVAASTPSSGYIIWNINSINPYSSSANSKNINAFATHRPNQYNNWAAQYGYYRVENFEYKIHCSNMENAQFIETTTPSPGTFVGATAQSDVILTLMPTQTDSDLSTIQNQLWEQKEANNVYLQGRSPGSSKTFHTFHGNLCSEDYDIDPLTTAADETWTAVGSNPATAKRLTLTATVASPYNTVALLPEAGVLVFVEFYITIQYAGYKPTLRQAIS